MNKVSTTCCSNAFSAIILIINFFLAMNCKAQSKLNYGLQQVQQAGTVPQSKALYHTPVLKKKMKPEIILAPATDGAYNLTAGWELTDDERANAPGEAIST